MAEMNPEAEALFESMVHNHTYKYIIFKIENGDIVVDIKGDPKDTETKEDKFYFEEMKSHWQSEPRYIVYEFSFTTSSEEKIMKMVLIFW